MDTVEDITDFHSTTITFEPEVATRFVGRQGRKRSSTVIGNSHNSRQKSGSLPVLERFRDVFNRFCEKVMGSNGSPSEEDKYDYYDYKRFLMCAMFD